MLVPPDNFALVEEGIYRSSKLDPINHSFLETLNLKSVVWMDEERPTRMVSQYLEDHRIKLHHLVDTSVLQEDGELSTKYKDRDWMVLKPATISKVFQVLLDSSNHNCLLVDKSEVVVGVLRHIEKWCYSSIANEYRLYSTNKANYAVESFLELINVELVPNDQDECEMSDTDSEKGSPLPAQDQFTSQSPQNRPTISGAINIRRPSTQRKSSDMADLRSSLQNSSVSSSKLSISTSPQIPMNLLKLAEDRRKQKQEDQQKRREITHIPTVRFEKKVYQFYKPKMDFTVVNDSKELQMTVKVHLPKEELLPQWFKELRNTWEAECVNST